jgi:uncharacterized membrane protein
MALQDLKDKENKELDKIIWIAAIAAIFLGIIVTAYLVLETKKESYSALYLKPDSYQNYINGNTVSFTYGVTSYETARTAYDLRVFLGENQVTGKQFTLEPGQAAEDTISFEIPQNASFPQKILLNMSANNQEYSVHFWVKGRK